MDKKKSDDEKRLSTVLLVTAIISLIQSAVDLIKHLLE